MTFNKSEYPMPNDAIIDNTGSTSSTVSPARLSASVLAFHASPSASSAGSSSSVSAHEHPPTPPSRSSGEQVPPTAKRKYREEKNVYLHPDLHSSRQKDPNEYELNCLNFIPNTNSQQTSQELQPPAKRPKIGS